MSDGLLALDTVVVRTERLARVVQTMGDSAPEVTAGPVATVRLYGLHGSIVLPARCIPELVAWLRQEGLLDGHSG